MEMEIEGKRGNEGMMGFFAVALKILVFDKAGGLL